MELYKRHNCIAQMGGSDRWGRRSCRGLNSDARVREQELFETLSSPLITTAAGRQDGQDGERRRLAER